MNTVTKMKPGKTDFAAIAETLGKNFPACADMADENDSFVADNYAALHWVHANAPALRSGRIGNCSNASGWSR